MNTIFNQYHGDTPNSQNKSSGWTFFSRIRTQISLEKEYPALSTVTTVQYHKKKYTNITNSCARLTIIRIILKRGNVFADDPSGAGKWTSPDIFYVPIFIPTLLSLFENIILHIRFTFPLPCPCSDRCHRRVGTYPYYYFISRTTSTRYHTVTIYT